MILKNISILYGNELKLLESVTIKISDNKFKKINSKITQKNQKAIDCKGLLLIPGFINRSPAMIFPHSHLISWLL